MPKHTKKNTVIALALILCLFPCAVTFAASKGRSIKEGNILYQKGNYAASLEKYNEALKKDPESDIINFNLGTALYQKGDYAQSIEHLQKSLLTETKGLKEKTHYNLGNAYYKSGVAHENDNLDFAVQSLEKSVDQYENALALDQGDRDAKDNYEFVKKELERIKKKQQQKQEQNQEKSDRQKSEDNKDNKGKEQQQKEQQSSASANKDPKQSQSQEPKATKGQSQEQKQDSSSQDKEQQQAASEDNPSNADQQNVPPTDAKHEKEDYNSQSPAGHEASLQQNLSKKDAEQLLENYQQTEAPQGLLNFHRGQKRVPSIFKDW